MRNKSYNHQRLQGRKQNRMSKVYVLQIIFVLVQVMAAVPLTIAVFGDRDPDWISVSAIVIWVGMIGNMICAIIRAAQESKKK